MHSPNSRIHALRTQTAKPLPTLTLEPSIILDNHRSPDNSNPGVFISTMTQINSLKTWPSRTQTDRCLEQRLASVQSHTTSDVGIQVKDNRYKEWLHFLCAKYSCSFLVAGCCFPFPILRNSFFNENSIVNHWDPTRRELCSVEDTCEEGHQGSSHRVGLLGTQPSPPGRLWPRLQ